MKPSVRASSVDGLRSELRDLRRLVMDLKREQTWQYDPPEAEVGGGVPTFFVAASDASDKSKSSADYVCEGTADEVEINAAMAAGIWGGRVVLSEGSFYLAASIEMRSGWSLLGLSLGTWLYSSAAVAITDLSEGIISDLALYGPASAGSKGIVITGQEGRVARLQLGSFASGIEVDGGWGHIRECRFSGGYTPAVDITLRSNLCWVVDNYLANKVVVDSGFDANNWIVGNYSDATGTAIEVVSGNYTVIDRNFLPSGAGSVTDSGSATNFGTNFSNVGPW